MTGGGESSCGGLSGLRQQTCEYLTSICDGPNYHSLPIPTGGMHGGIASQSDCQKWAKFIGEKYTVDQLSTYLRAVGVLQQTKHPSPPPAPAPERPNPAEEPEPVDTSAPSGGPLTFYHFWGTWCDPCMAEIKDVVAFANELQDQGVRILFFASERTETGVKEAKKILKKNGVTFETQILSDETRREVEKTLRTKIDSLPRSILASAKNGKTTPLTTVRGTMEPADYRAMLAKAQSNKKPLPEK